MIESMRKEEVIVTEKSAHVKEREKKEEVIETRETMKSENGDVLQMREEEMTDRKEKSIGIIERARKEDDMVRPEEDFRVI